MLQRKHDLAMNELKDLRAQHSQCEKTSDYHLKQYRAVLGRLDSTTQELQALTIKYSDLLVWKRRLELETHNLNQARKEDRLEVIELRKQLQQAIANGNGTNETLNRLYVENLRKSEALKGNNKIDRRRGSSDDEN